MKHLGMIFLSGLIAFLSGCTTVVESVNEDPITLDTQERTWGSWIDDQTIETVAAVNINKADLQLKEASRIKVVSFNGILLIMGQVPNDELKELAGSTANEIQQVRKVYNELEVGEPIDLFVQGNDSWLTTKIKTAITTNDAIDSDIKVNTERGTVYLMGLVTPQTAQEAVAIARDTYGVQKVVKVFEYTR